ncbi:ATP-binding protein [Mesorhizobium sp. CA14]|uniref:AlbA family DNA-binding domain-containing protein n=1 Tax=Mesorhizobium sp. CA14 TaxID=2876642 RepID=UPI001CCCB57D|nr:ATP-binding protein [Mesorhizobium sp. CA14]MBZ9849496.1 ATP-binding protein [Mesorhizobium sp. CA14]
MEIVTMINRPAVEWSFADFETVAKGALPESLTLEFKGDFEAGADERWRKSQDQISTRSRDRLAEEIVAFANAYGGVLLLGIKEEVNGDGIKVSAGLGSVIPSVSQCAERLESSLRAVIDPPLPLLEVKAIKATEDGAGYIVFKVPQSLSAPHGVGRPAAGYVRRGSSCEPMTMRDLQSVFWEARTAIDRVNETFRIRRELFARDLVDRFLAPSFPSHVLFRATVVPGRHFQIPHLPSIFGRRTFQSSHIPFQSAQPLALTFGGPIWRPMAGGVTAREGDNTEFRQLSVSSDGTWNLMCRHIAIRERHYPGWYSVGALWLLYNAMRFRRHIGRVEVPLFMEAEILGSKDGEVVFVTEFDGEVKAPISPACTDRLELGRDGEFDDVAQLFAEQIGWACGLDIDCSDMRLGPNLSLKL